MVDACARLKGGKLAKEKLKEQLQKIATKRTGGQKIDEILGHDSGPEGLPHSIIVTEEGPAGDAPELPSVAPTDAASTADSTAVDAEPALPSMAKDNSPSAATTKPRATKPRQQRGAKPPDIKQMTLALEKPSKKAGKKNGGKKTKK